MVAAEEADVVREEVCGWDGDIREKIEIEATKLDAVAIPKMTAKGTDAARKIAAPVAAMPKMINAMAVILANRGLRWAQLLLLGMLVSFWVVSIVVVCDIIYLFKFIY